MRYINVTVIGVFAEKSSKNAGVQGEGNATSLVIRFDSSWDNYNKRIVWRDAHGENPTSVLFTAAHYQNDGTYILPIPSEPLAIAGWCSFTIEGYAAATPSQIAMTVTEDMQVLPSENFYEPAEPTPSQALQLQRQIDNIHMVAGPPGATGPAGPTGPIGPPLVIKGLYANIGALQAAHATGTAGDVWAVGTAASNTLYLWDTVTSAWVDIGNMEVSSEHIADTNVHIQTGERTAWTGKAKVWTSASDPTANDDTGDGISAKDIWINTTSGESFVCTANTAGAATWVQFGGLPDTTVAPVKGSSTFNGYSTGRVITHNLGTTNYDVMITPKADPSGLLGEVWVIKSANTCAVKNSGTATTAFDYRITPWPV